MQAELHSWLIAAGYPADIDLTPMPGHMGSTSMWRLTSPHHHAPLIVRVFSKAGVRGAHREARAMAAAALNGVPVPDVLTQGEINDRPFLVTSFIAGEPAIHMLEALPASMHALGVTMGETLGRINEAIAPPDLHDTPDAWLERGGPSLAPLHAKLAALPDQNRLLHLDYHLLNIMTQAGRITGVIDWENATAGPPHMDLARSRAILRVVLLGKRYPEIEPETIIPFERGLIEGHARVIGSDPHPELSTAWGLAMTTLDLSTQVGKPGSPFTQSLIDQLATERDAAIQTALNSPEPGST